MNKLDIDKVIQNTKYKISNDIDKKIFYVFIYDEKEYEIKEITCSDKNQIDLDIPNNTNFIISLHENSTILYKWAINNKINQNILKLNDIRLINLNNVNTKIKGISYNRRNFYFSTAGKGSQELVLNYRRNNSSQPSDNAFEIRLKINVK